MPDVKLLLFFFFFLSGILFPWPGIEPEPPALEEQSLKHWSAREVSTLNFDCWGIHFKALMLNKDINSAQLLTPTLCNPVDYGTPGLPVHHQLPESTQTHVYWVGDAIQPSPPLSSLFPPALNLSQNQSLFQWVSSSHEVAKVLEFQLQHQSFQWIFRTDFPAIQLNEEPTMMPHLWRSPFRKPCVTRLLALFTFSVL